MGIVIPIDDIDWIVHTFPSLPMLGRNRPIDKAPLAPRLQSSRGPAEDLSVQRTGEEDLTNMGWARK